MRILGIDSATKTGFGLVERVGTKERLISYGAVDLGRGPMAAAIETFVERVIEDGPIDEVAIEDNYLAAGEQANVVTLKCLARLAGRWEQAFEARGIRTVLVMAQKWQTGLLGGALMGPTANRATRKKAAGLWVKATFGVTPGEDACDGIGLAAYRARHATFAQLVGAGPVRAGRAR